MDQVRDLVQMITGDANERAKKLELRDEFQGVVRHTIKVRTTRLSRYQRQTGLLTFTSALAAAATQLMRAVPDVAKDQNGIARTPSASGAGNPASSSIVHTSPCSRTSW